MTKKLYYEDPYLLDFESMVNKVDQDKRGIYVVLEETAFYPTGGGQPHDQGTINGVYVYDVEEVQDEVRHYIEEQLPKDTLQVNGRVDEKRRIDHMQQHCGQHIISAVFEDQFGIPTTSFHLGKDTVTIDLDTDHLSEHTLQQAEARVNQLIFQNEPVETKWVSVEEAQAYPLRKALSVDGDIRLVIIPGIDYNGCGGTHPRSTGEIMAVKFLGWTKNKQQVRLEFVCGYRVLDRLEEKHRILSEVKQLISRPEQQLPEEVNQLIKESKEKDKRLAEMEEHLLQYEAREIISEAENAQVIVRVFKDRMFKTLQSLGKLITEKAPNSYLILISEQQEQLQFVLARGAEIDRNMNEIAKETMPLIEGKGGGKPEFVQGGGPRLLDGAEFAEQIKRIL
ncbi:DHHA1 domain-containing protein [Halobacillus rhizosphaerae]|uniref:alanyl-tRNA editing protein n=1 Tax=Halobacillus rhizosphaerae TaxID=3064889 RepID=UPI00398BB2ED